MEQLNKTQLAGLIRNALMFIFALLASKGIDLGISSDGINAIVTNITNIIIGLSGACAVCYSSVTAPEKTNGRGKAFKSHLLDDKTLKTLSELNPTFKELLIHALHESTDAICLYDGLRTVEEQKHYVKIGKSWTMQSKHLQQADGFAHAVDFYKVGVNGQANWKDWNAYERFARLVQKIAPQYGLNVVWGGDWKKRDGTHLEIS